MPETKYASFATEDLRESSNLFDDVDATITAIQFGKNPPASNYEADGNPIYGRVDYLLDGSAPAEERAVNQFYSLGATAGDQFDIAADGHGLIPKQDTVASLRKGSKWSMYTMALQACGVPNTILRAGNFAALIGLHGHFKRVLDPARTFADQDKRTRPNAQKKVAYPPSTLVLTKLLTMPNEVAKANGAVKTAKTILTPVPMVAMVEESGDVDTDTTPYLMAALTKAKGKLHRGQILLAVNRAADGNPQKQVYAKRAQEEDFLTNLSDMGLIIYAATDKNQPISLPVA